MPRTLPELCARYRQDLAATLAPVTGNGPLTLVGYCFGGGGCTGASLSAAGCWLQCRPGRAARDRCARLEGSPPEVFHRVAALLRVAERWDLSLPSADLRTPPEEVVIAHIMAAAADTPLARAYAERTLRAIVDTQEASRDMVQTWTRRLPSGPVYLIRAAE